MDTIPLIDEIKSVLDRMFPQGDAADADDFEDDPEIEEGQTEHVQQEALFVEEKNKRLQLLLILLDELGLKTVL